MALLLAGPLGCMTEEPVRGPGRVGADVAGLPSAGSGSTAAPMPGTGSMAGDVAPPPATGGGEPTAPVVTGGGTASEPPMAGGEPPPTADRVFDAGTDPARNDVQGGDLCTRLAQIQCAGEAFCCDNPGRDRASCEDAQRAGCMAELYLDAVSADPIVGFDPVAAKAAFTDLETMASQCDPGIAAFGASATGLLGIFKGTRAVGESCSPGGLDMAAAAAALASCSDVANNACLPANALSWSCEPRGGVGSPCFSDLNCHEGLMCPNPTFSFGEVACAARRPAGSPCQLPNECESLACKGGTCAPAGAQSAYCLQ